MKNILLLVLLALVISCSDRKVTQVALLQSANGCCNCSDSGIGEAGAGQTDSGTDSGVDSGVDSGAPFVWRSDPRIIAFYDPNVGYSDARGSVTLTSAPWGSLTEVGGAVALGAGPDGRNAWSLRKATGGYLKSERSTFYMPPIHMLAVLRSVGVPALHDTWIGNSGGIRLCAHSSTQTEVLGLHIPFWSVTHSNWHLYDVYFHDNLTRYSIDGAPYVTINTGTQGAFLGVTLGAFLSGGTPINRSDVDIAWALFYEGQRTAEFTSAVWAELGTTFPSLALPATPQPVFTERASDPGNLLASPFDFVIITGQSQNSNYALRAGAYTFDSDIYELGNDNTVKAAQLKYDDTVDQSDQVEQENPNSLHPYGNAIAMANALHAASGKPLLIIPCAVGGSSVEPASPGVEYDTWDPSFPRGFRLQNSIFGSCVSRVQDISSRPGANYRFTWHWQGETEALYNTQSAINAWIPDTDAMLTEFYSRTGLPERTIYAQIAATPHSTLWPAFRTMQAGLASASRIMVTPPDGPYNSSTDLHEDGPACDVIGTTVANSALAAGW